MRTIASAITAAAILSGGGFLTPLTAQTPHVIQTPKEATWGPAPPMLPPGAQIAVMGPQAAINAVYYNELAAIEDEGERARRTEELREEYAEDIDVLHLASELVVDAVVELADLRAELDRRFGLAASKRRTWPAKRNPVTPV